jgi:hypothetical protein
MTELKKLINNSHSHLTKVGAFYLLIDAAQEPDLMKKWLSQHQNQPIRSLFEGTLEEAHPLYVAPLLLKIPHDRIDDLSHDVSDWLAQSAMVNVLHTELETDDLIKHLQPFLDAKLPDGDMALFRLFDPTVAVLLPKMLSKEHYISLMTPISGWWVALDDETFERLPYDKKEMK